MDLKVELGRDLNGDPVIWEAHDNVHLTITGQCGQGKSYKMTSMILQLESQGIHTIILDGSGEYGKDAPGKPHAWSLLDSRHLDASSPELPIGTFFQWVLPSGKVEDRSQCARRAAGTLKQLFNLGPNQYAYLKQVCYECLLHDNELSFASIMEHLMDVATSATDSEECTEEETKEAKLAASLLPKLDVLEDFPKTNADWFDAFTKPGTTIIDIQDIYDPYLLKNILEIMLGNLWTHKIRSKSECPLLLVFDECQDLNFKPGSILDRILRKGRKHDICGWFSTQFYKDADMTKALGQAAADICFRPARQDFRKVAALLAPNDEELYDDCIEALNQLEPGTFFFYDKETPVLVDGWDREA